MTALLSHSQIPVQGMSCASCSARIERALQKLPNVTSVHVNLTTEHAYLESTSPLTLAQIIDTVRKTGFDVPTHTIELEISGMSCASCSTRLERIFLKRSDVLGATVNLATERATITGTATQQDLSQAIKTAGFASHTIEASSAPHETAEESHIQGQKNLLRALISAVCLWGAIAAVEMVPWVRHVLGTPSDAVLQFLLTSALLVGPGRVFFTLGFPALWRRTPTMNSLVAVGSMAAYLYSACATFFPDILPHGTVQLYYEAAAGIVTLVLVGRFLEAHAKGRTSAALRALSSLQPSTARVLRDGHIKEETIENIIRGDIIDMRPGERLPVDGVITEGESWIDEAMVTGEPMAVSKAVGDSVIGGTVNQNGAFRFRTTAVGGDTMLSHIISMVETAQGSKLPIQSRVNAITRWFVPAIIALSILVFFLWLALGPRPSLSFSLINAVAVLIAACPCAMGLATPTAIMVGTGRGAELGILFRQGEALQTLAQSTVVAFDKTGTLTEGRPQLTDTYILPDIDRTSLLRYVAAIEARSEHPLAKALTHSFPQQNAALPQVTHFESVTGMGVQGMSDGVMVHIGSARFLEKLSCDLSTFEEKAAAFAKGGKTPLYVALNKKPSALLAVSDPLKATSKDALHSLQKLGLTTVMITGDQYATAQAIGNTLGIHDIVANVLPRGKVDALKARQDQGHHVIFVGDGINDAPALAQADVGIAMGNGTDIAMEAADIVLVRGHIEGVAQAIALSRATLRTIKQNLFWAFAYNITLVPIAAGVLYPVWEIALSPMFAAGAMALSSVCVLSNTLRLRRFTTTLRS